MDLMGGGNGQWVRARNKEGAKSFLDEKQTESDRLAGQRRREREFFLRIVARVRGWFSRS